MLEAIQWGVVWLGAGLLVVPLFWINRSDRGESEGAGNDRPGQVSGPV